MRENGIPFDVVDAAERIELVELDHDGLQAEIGRGIYAGNRRSTTATTPGSRECASSEGNRLERVSDAARQSTRRRLHQSRYHDMADGGIHPRQQGE